MIKKYKQFNESLLDKIEGPTTEDILKNGNVNKLLKTGAKENNFELVKIAVENGANVINYIAEIMFYAIHFKNKEMIIYLLEQGIKLSDENIIGLLKIHDTDFIKKAFTLNFPTNRIPNEVLFYAVAELNVEIVKYLIDLGLDVNFENHISLKTAIQKGVYEIVELLVNNGAEITSDVLDKSKHYGTYIDHYLRMQIGKTNESLLDKITGPIDEDIWKHYGYDRMFDDVEDFLNYNIKKIEEKEYRKYPNSLFLIKNGKVLFEIDYNKKRIVVDYEDLWTIFENVFNMDYKQIVNLLEKYFIKKYNSYNYDYYWLNSSMNPKWYEIGQRNHIKESLLDKIEGPTKEEVWKSFGYDNVFDTPQDFLDYIFDNIKDEHFENYGNSTFLLKDDKILFEISYFEQRVYVEYFDVWKILKDLFHLSIYNIDNLIEDNLLKRKYYINNYKIYHYSNLVNSRWWFNKKNHRDYIIKESLLDKISGPSTEEVINNNPDKALMFGIKNEDIEVVKLAIAHDADVRLRNYEPFKESVTRSNNEITIFLTNILLRSATQKEKDMVLCYGAAYNNLQVVKLAVESGADINIYKSEPLRNTIKYGYTDIANYLKEKGAKI